MKYPAPEHSKIVEPFAGSAGYSLRYPDRNVVLCDTDPVVSGIWSYLIGVGESEVLCLPDLEHGQTVDDLDIIQEARWLIGFWLNKGSASPCRTPSKWMRSQIRPKSYWGPEIRQRIASQLVHIRHWTVLNGSYDSLDVTQSATWFVDPPYQLAGKDYRYSSKKLDFDKLASWCQKLCGQTIVCENDGADWLPFKQFHSINSTPGRLRTGRSVEVVWTRNCHCTECNALKNLATADESMEKFEP